MASLVILAAESKYFHFYSRKPEVQLQLAAGLVAFLRSSHEELSKACSDSNAFVVFTCRHTQATQFQMPDKPTACNSTAKVLTAACLLLTKHTDGVLPPALSIAEKTELF